VALALAERGVRVSLARLSPTVHGPDDHGFMSLVVAAARAAGASGYPGDGTQRWSAVHRLDAAVLYRLALEKAPAGSVLHGAGEEGVPLRDVAEVVGKQLDLPVGPVTDEEAAARFGFLARLLALDIPASSAATQELLGWRPTHPGLLDDLAAGLYTA
jgi:nucleoside-diphosphate-sugar epimerase